ncbi:hypothetical protein [Mesorhizobium retamae]|uniref:DUF2198 family protein n=1 Tax=Mesorhizobium retamae TaxID=2912854 RepID=A0ABS9QQA9_9HYPH|nr:hypothetical protein [Mesorhizobium sp. IRAMC:0171]MCG7508739.1 hypothetical protein [Mesorhizobium sp. IRAMC:0171]
MESDLLILFFVPLVLILIMPGRRSFCAVAAVLAIIAAGYAAWIYYLSSGDPFGLAILQIIVVPWILGWATGVILKSAWFSRRSKPQEG